MKTNFLLSAFWIFFYFALSSPADAQCVVDPGFSPTVTIGTGSTLVSSFLVGDFTGENIHLQGELIIDVDFEINSSKVLIDQFEVITIVAPNSLLIDGSTVSNCDDHMWRSIIIESGARLVVRGASTIENGFEAIVSEGGLVDEGVFIIRNSFLMNNHTAIKVEPYSGGPHGGMIRKTEIAAPNLIEPFLADIGKTAIYIDEVNGTDGITIGRTDQVLGSGGHNYIHDYENGIYAINSIVKVQNNIFDRIIQVSTSGYSGVAIGAIGSGKAELYVGAPDPGLVGVNNRITNCDRGGVGGLNLLTAEIDRNEIVGLASTTTGPQRFGVWLNSSASASRITNNTIQDFDDFGVWLQDWSNLITVANNLIENVNIDHNADFETTGIRAIGTVQGRVHAINNTIEHVQRGIIVAGLGAIGSPPIIEGNNIEFFNPVTSNKNVFGVAAVNSDGVQILSNSIMGDCPNCPEPLDPDGRIGILLRGTASFLADGNNIYDCTYGSLAEDNCAGGNYTCNWVNDCTRGFAFTNPAGIGWVGPVTEDAATLSPSGNCWYPISSANRTHAYFSTLADNIDWYYNEFFGCHDMEILGVALNTDDGGVSVPVDVLVSPGIPCGIPPLPGPRSAFRENMLKQHVNLLLTSGLTSCSTYEPRRSIYNYFDNNPSDLTLGHPDDSRFQNLFSYLESENFDEIRSIESEMESRDFISASSTIAGMGNICLQDADYRTINSILLAGRSVELSLSDVLSGTLPYTTSQLTTINLIANKSASLHGQAVYIARAMIRDPLLDVISLAKPELTSIYEDIESPIVVGPNPFSDALYVDVPDDITGYAVKVYDLQGRIVKEISGSPAYLDLGKLDKSMYILVIEQNGERLFSQSVIKID